MGHPPRRRSDLDLNAVQAFARVLEEGSFRGAARGLGVPKSTLSRKVAALESALGAQLLVRTTRTVRVTEIGAAYHRQAAAALAALEQAARGVDELQAQPRGLLRISVPVAMGELVLGPLLREFLAAHPEVQVVADVSDRPVDLLEEGFDAAIRAGTLADSSLVARKLGESPLQLVASPAYLARRRPPRRPADLAAHDCILFPGRPGPIPWVFKDRRRTLRVMVTGRCAVGSFPAVVALAEAGFGIARVPAFWAREGLRGGRLVPLLERFLPPPAGLYVLYPASRIVSPKLRAFLDHLAARAPALLPG